MGKSLWSQVEEKTTARKVATEYLHEEEAHYQNYNGDKPVDTVGPEESVTELVADADSTLTIVEEATVSALEQIHLVSVSIHQLNSHTPCSEKYMLTMENYRPVLERMFENFGMRSTWPSLEDFSNKWKAESAHAIATEGMGDFIRKLWKKIREFFQAFFKKSMLFLKRLVKANLDMEDYEKYLTPMMVRLGKGKAVVNDNTEFDSKLPSLLADEGMENMSVDYLLNSGVRKIDRLVDLMNTIGFKGVGKLNERDGLPLLSVKLSEFVKKHRSIGSQPVTTLIQDANDIELFAYGLMLDIFKVTLTDPRDMPEAVYEAMSQTLDRSDFTSDVHVRALGEVNAGRDSLPKNANLFMVRGASGKVVVEGHVETNTYVRNIMTPPANFTNLRTLYDFYRNRVSKVQVKNADKSIDIADDIISKCLTVVTNELATIMDQVGGARASSDIDRFVDLSFEIASRTKTTINSPFVTEKMDNALGTYYDPNAGVHIPYGWEEIPELKDDIWRWADTYQKLNDNNHREWVRNVFGPQVKKVITSLGLDFNQWLTEVAEQTGVGESGPAALSDEDVTAARESISKLSRYLTNFFTRLQTLFRFVMTGVYGSYTEVRYEFVRYLYISAQRYRAD